MKLVLSLFLTIALIPTLIAQEVPKPSEGDYIVHNFHFTSGESLPELRIHYTTLGTLQRDAAGHATNAVLIMHGTTGSGHQFFAPQFAGELFGPGQPLDARRYYIILPDDIGHGAVDQAVRRPAREVPALRLPRHGRGRARARDEAARRRSPAARDGHVDGLHALVDVGRDHGPTRWTR